jgi:hypothetical protein
MGVTHSPSRSAARLALVTDPPPAAPDAPTGVPAGLRLLRSLDRAVLEVARGLGLRPMELYALILLSDDAPGQPVTTRELADRIAASTSQAKQIALRLARYGYATRGGAHGRTCLTDEGRMLAARATERLELEIGRRLSGIESSARELGGAALVALTLDAAG